MKPTFTIYVDGASRGNPGPAGAGIYVVHNEKPIIQEGFYLGKTTNNQAEYLALVLALLAVKKLCHDEKIEQPHLTIISDSELMIKQLKGLYSVKNEILKQLKNIVDDQLKTTVYQCRHVLREHNKHADALANQGIDKKQKIPTSFTKILSHYGL